MTKRFRIDLFLVGLLMGIAEIVPGFSGGTVAFLSGIYEELLLSIASFHPANFILLFRGKWKEFDKAVHWRFMLSLLPGMFFSLIAFSHVVHFFLSDPLRRSYLYAIFFGFILASTYLCYKRVKLWSPKLFLCLCLGAILAYIFTVLTRTETSANAVLSFAFLGLNAVLILAGMAGITAMLLPGISGSYVFLVLGFYPLIIKSLQNPTDSTSFLILLNLAIGIVCGALMCAKIVHWLIKHHHDIAIATLTGFIIGAIGELWPFWHYQQTASSMILIPISPYFPPLDNIITWTIFATMGSACAIALTLEMLVLKKQKAYRPSDK